MKTQLALKILQNVLPEPLAKVAGIIALAWALFW